MTESDSYIQTWLVEAGATVRAGTPLLVVETSQVDLHSSDEAVDDLIRQIRSLNRGTRYYVPRA